MKLPCIDMFWSTNQAPNFPIRINKHPIPAARWQQGSQKCYATIVKIYKSNNNSKTREARDKNKQVFVEFYDVCVTKLKNNQIQL